MAHNEFSSKKDGNLAPNEKVDSSKAFRTHGVWEEISENDEINDYQKIQRMREIKASHERLEKMEISKNVCLKCGGKGHFAHQCHNYMGQDLKEIEEPIFDLDEFGDDSESEKRKRKMEKKKRKMEKKRRKKEKKERKKELKLIGKKRKRTYDSDKEERRRLKKKQKKDKKRKKKEKKKLKKLEKKNSSKYKKEEFKNRSYNDIIKRVDNTNRRKEERIEKTRSFNRNIYNNDRSEYYNQLDKQRQEERDYIRSNESGDRLKNHYRKY